MTALKKTQAGKSNAWLRRFNRKVTNPIMMTFAGRRFYMLVEHVGRRSKKIYHTPVLGQPSGEGFMICLPYGEDTDWCLNVLAAGGCLIRWNGRGYSLTDPRIVGQAAAESVFPGGLLWLLKCARVRKYLYADQFNSNP